MQLHFPHELVTEEQVTVLCLKPKNKCGQYK